VNYLQNVGNGIGIGSYEMKNIKVSNRDDDAGWVM